MAKNMCNMSCLTTDNYKGFIWQLTKKSCSPSPPPGLVHSQCTTISGSSYSQGLSLVPGGPCSYTYLHFWLRYFPTESSISGVLGGGLPQASAKIFYGSRENRWKCQRQSITHTFHSLPTSLHLESLKLQEPLFGGLARQ